MVQVAAADPENPFKFCGLPLDCGHNCKGVEGESDCLPCIKTECIQDAIDLYDQFMELPALVRKGSDPPRRAIQMSKGAPK